MHENEERGSEVGLAQVVGGELGGGGGDKGVAATWQAGKWTGETWPLLQEPGALTASQVAMLWD